MRSADNDGYLNVRDGIRQGDETETPLQFVYEEADCRIWYEASMTVNVEAMWEKTTDVAWGGVSCVEGSIGPKRETERSQREQKEGAKGHGGRRSASLT